MSITEILEKYATKDPYGMTFIEDDLFPEIESDLNKLLEDRAKEFAEWIDIYCTATSAFNTFKYNGTYKTTSELYALFLTNKNKTDENRS